MKIALPEKERNGEPWKTASKNDKGIPKNPKGKHTREAENHV